MRLYLKTGENMRLPKPENWTQRTSERVLSRIERLFEQYEKKSVHDEHGRETNQQAIDIELEMWRLWDFVPVEHRPRHRPF